LQNISPLKSLEIFLYIADYLKIHKTTGSSLLREQFSENSGRDILHVGNFSSDLLLFVSVTKTVTCQ